LQFLRAGFYKFSSKFSAVAYIWYNVSLVFREYRERGWDESWCTMFCYTSCITPCY